MTEDEVARRCAATMYATDTAAHDLGITVDEVTAGRAIVRMTVAGRMLNGWRIVHGGYVFLLADTAFAYACNSHDVVTVAAGGEIVFVSSAREGDELVATAVERARYGRNGVYDVTVTTGDGALVAEFRGRSASRRDPILPTG